MEKSFTQKETVYVTRAEAAKIENVAITTIIDRIQKKKYPGAKKCPHCKNNWIIPVEELFVNKR
jgi:hypothetical protein